MTYTPHPILSRVVRWAGYGDIYGGEEKHNRVFVGKPEGKK